MSADPGRAMAALARKHFDDASYRGCLRVQHAGRQFCFQQSPWTHPWEVVKAAVEREARECMVCMDAPAVFACIFCGHGFCEVCLGHPATTTLSCSVCKAMPDFGDPFRDDLFRENWVIHEDPGFVIECIASFEDSPQDFFDVEFTWDGSDLRLRRALEEEEERGPPIRTLVELVCAMLDVAGSSAPLADNLYKLSTCVMTSAYFPADTLDAIRPVNALVRRNGKLFFAPSTRDDVEQGVVDAAAQVVFTERG